MSLDPLQVAKQALQRAQRAGAKQAEAYIGAAHDLTVSIRDGRADSVKQADGAGLGLRVLVDGRSSLVYSTDFRPDALASLAERAVALAKQAPADPANQIAPDGGPPVALELFDEAVAAITPDRAVAMAVEAESAARATDARVKATQNAGTFAGHGRVVVLNSNGVERSYRHSVVGVFIGVLAADEGGKQRSGNEGAQRRFLADLPAPAAIGAEAARRAARMVGARPVATQKLPVIMHRTVASNWLGNLSSAFSGEQVFKKGSYLADKLGQAVASPLVTVVDDPHMARTTGAKPFDAEGVPTRRMVLVEKGTVKGFVYNLRWAAKANAASTGHAVRNYTSSPDIGFHAFHMQNGTTPVDQLIRGIDHGFYLTNTGAFGYDPATGGWSYAASGLMIEKGELAQPVTDVSLASDTLAMLAGIEAVGDDLRFEGGANAPHLRIKEMALSGT